MGKLLEQDNVIIKKEIGDMEVTVQKLEQEKTARDHTIKTLNEEIASQDEVINKLTKEKKHVGENAKSAEDLLTAEEKLSHMGQVTKKLEGTLDELEGSLEKEKKNRANVERERRKIEGELKVAQETVNEMERSRKELEASYERKDRDLSGMLSKLEDEQSLVAKIQK